MLSGVIISTLLLAKSVWSAPLNTTDTGGVDYLVNPWEIEFYGDQFCDNLVGSGGSRSATGCLSVGSGGAESFVFHSGGNFGVRLWPQAGCAGSIHAVGGSVSCSLAGFKIHSYQVIGAR